MAAPLSPVEGQLSADTFARHQISSHTVGHRHPWRACMCIIIIIRDCQHKTRDGIQCAINHTV